MKVKPKHIQLLDDAFRAEESDRRNLVQVEITRHRNTILIVGTVDCYEIDQSMTLKELALIFKDRAEKLNTYRKP